MCYGTVDFLGRGFLGFIASTAPSTTQPEQVRPGGSNTSPKLSPGSGAVWGQVVGRTMKPKMLDHLCVPLRLFFFLFFFFHPVNSFSPLVTFFLSCVRGDGLNCAAERALNEEGC